MINWNVVNSMIDHPFEEKWMFDNWIIPQLESQPEEGWAMEIGVRRGGTSFAMIQAIAQSSNPQRPLLGCDPWGDLPYAVGQRIEQPNYGEQFYRDAMISLSIVAKECKVFHHLMRLTSFDFMKIFDDINFYRDGKELGKKFSIVYLDGLHSVEAVSKELEWFKDRMLPGGMIIIDDTHEIAFSDHPTIKWMFEKGEVRRERTMLIID